MAPNYKQAWIELYRAFGERMQQSELDLMDGVLSGVKAAEEERKLEQRDIMIEPCIRFWESKLQYDRFLLSPDTQILIENTIRLLKLW